MYWRILQLKNLENRLTFDRIMAVSSMCSFFALKVSVRFSQERTHNSGVFQDSSLWKYQKPTKMSTEVKHYCIPSKLIYFSAETSLLTIFLKSCLDLLRSSRSCQNIGRRDSFISGDRWRLSALLSMSLPCLVDLRQMSYALLWSSSWSFPSSGIQFMATFAGLTSGCLSTLPANLSLRR